MSGVAPPKPENRNPVKPSPLVTAVAPGSRKDAVPFLLTSGKTVSGIQAVSLPGQEWKGSRKPGIEGGRVSSRFWLYKRMINDNSIRNKTKHLSCCQSNEAST